MIVGAKPISTPLPDIPCGVVESITIRFVLVHWCSGEIAVVARVVYRELPLPDVATVITIRPKLVSPRIAFVLKSTTGGVLPLRFGGESFACPLCVGLCVVPRDVSHWMREQPIAYHA